MAAIFGLKKPLRKCTKCGLEAWAEEDLHSFKRNSNYPYGRANVCKICDSKDRSRYYGKHKERLPKNVRQKKLIEGFPKPLTCFFCGGLITKLTGCDADSLAIHSLDGNHENWKTENKSPSHIRCHSIFHNKNKKNPNEELIYQLIPYNRLVLENTIVLEDSP